MRARNVTVKQMQAALDKANEKYQGNLEWERFEPNGKGVDFTLRVKSSKGPGHRLGFSGKRLAKACWHAHGDFFEALLAVEPGAVVSSSWSGGKITIDRDGGNWQDCNIGSQCRPMMFSEACECE